MRQLIAYSFLLFFLSCEQTEPTIVDEIRVTYRDHFLNGKKSIDSLKELSVQEGLNGNLPRMKELCELVAELDNKDADNLSRLSMVYFIDKNYNQGLTTINRSIKADTGNYLTHNLAYKACLFYELNSNDSSEYYFKKMLTNSNNGLDLNSLTHVLNIFRDEDRFYKYNNLTLKYYPLNEDANLAEAIRVYQTKPNEAIQIINRLESKVKTARVYATRSLFYHNLGKYELALSDANQAVEMSHGEPWIVTGRGRTRHLLKDFRGAEVDYKYSIDHGDTAAKSYYELLIKDMNKQ